MLYKISAQRYEINKVMHMKSCTQIKKIHL